MRPELAALLDAAKGFGLGAISAVGKSRSVAPCNLGEPARGSGFPSQILCSPLAGTSPNPCVERLFDVACSLTRKPKQGAE